MGINPNDGYYKAEQTSPSILAMRDPLCAAYGVGPGNFGAKGNLSHDHGYHRSLNWVLHSPDSRYGARDYSATLAADKGNDDDVAAIDFTPGEWGTPDNRRKMIAITSRMIDALRRDDPRVSAVREFAGTLDGEHVVTYDHSRHAFKAPFDSSHLNHGHTSLYRTMTRVSHAGIVSVMLGEPMAEFTDRQIADLTYTLGISPTATNAGVPPVHVRLAALENALADVVAKLDGLAARPASPVELTGEQTAQVADAARGGALDGVGKLRLTVETG
jgi:hypothetical protein